MTEIVIRRCRRADLRAHAWGPYRDAMATIARVFELAQRGNMVMLVASCGHLLVGQGWLDLARYRCGAVLWALRVKPSWRRRGVGSRLVAAAEQTARRAGRHWIQIEVEPHNGRARELYARLGYAWVQRRRVPDAITGAQLSVELDIMRRELGSTSRSSANE